MSLNTQRVKLTEESQALIARELQSGRFESSDDIVNFGLQLLERRSRLEQEKQHLRSIIDEAWEDAKSSEVIDGEQFFAELLGEKSAKPRKRKRA